MMTYQVSIRKYTFRNLPLKISGMNLQHSAPPPIVFPRKRYDEVAREVLETSKLSADDPAKQFAMTFFDNKFNSLVPLKALYFLG